METTRGTKSVELAEMPEGATCSKCGIDHPLEKSSRIGAGEPPEFWCDNCFFADYHSDEHRDFDPRCTSCQLIRMRAEREA